MAAAKDSFAALRFKDFRLYIGIRFFFTFAYQMQIVILGFYVYQLTRNPFTLGLLGLCEAIPAIGISLYGGYIADKSEKKKMLQFIYSSVLLSTLVMFIATMNSMAASIPAHWIVPIIFSMIFVNGVARAFYGPAAFTIFAHSVPKEHYANASTWSSTSWQIASIVGPALGGLIYGFSENLIPGVSGITFTLAVVLALLVTAFILVQFLRKYPAMFKPKENIWKSVGEGLNFVFSNRLMLGAISLDLFSVFFGGAVALLPVFAHEILHVGAEGLGLMRAAISSGAVITMLVMSKYSPMGRPWRNLLIAVAGFGLSIIAFGLSTSFYLTLFFLFTQGAFDSVSVVIRGTIMQLMVPDEMRGRVSAVNSMFISSSNEIGDFESGTAASILGTVRAVLFGGCMTLGIVAFTFFKTRKYIPITLDEINPPKTHE
ncbi:MAG: MFS transporter [Bacteroidota bacterium]